MKLNSDDANLMPITDTVYGKRRGRPADEKPRAARKGWLPLWEAIPQDVLDKLADIGKDTKRFAARRRQS